MSFKTEYDAYCAAHGAPGRIEMLLCDMNAILRGKWLPGDSADKLVGGDVRLPLSTYALNIQGEEVAETGLGIVAGDPDGVVRPVPGTLKPAPWLGPDVAQVQIYIEEDEVISGLDPRGALARLVERFGAAGLTPVVATELEFYVYRQRAEDTHPPVPPAHTPTAQTFDMDTLDRSRALLDDILAHSKAQGIPTDTLIAEYGPGQFEVNFHHVPDPLAAADFAVWFRRLVKGTALRHGLEASFMAKPYAEQPGNGMHVHASILDADGRNIFAVQSGIAPPLLHAIGGLIASIHDAQAVFAPHMNSYRRFLPNSFAPTAPCWAEDHRGVAIRIPATSGKGARLEHRISGADVNPYLAMAAILGGMLMGLETKADPGPPTPHEGAPDVAPLDHDWHRAVERFGASEFTATLFGERFRDIYCAMRRDEISQLTRQITEIEYRTYLGKI